MVKLIKEINFTKIWHLVVHHKKKPYDVYIGRPSKWGNPYSHQEDTLAQFKVETRDEAIEKYEALVRSNPETMEMIKKELKNKILSCHCTPKLCHGHILAWIANEED